MNVQHNSDQWSRYAQSRNAVLSKQDEVVAEWLANGIQWRELRVWGNPGFRYFVQRELAPGVWG